MIAITGNTFPVKDQIKALGGRWNAADKAWMVPADKADAARALVSGAPQQQRKNYSGYSNRRSGGSGWGRQCMCRQCQSGSESLCERDWGRR